MPYLFFLRRYQIATTTATNNTTATAIPSAITTDLCKIIEGGFSADFRPAESCGGTDVISVYPM